MAEPAPGEVPVAEGLPLIVIDPPPGNLQEAIQPADALLTPGKTAQDTDPYFKKLMAGYTACEEIINYHLTMIGKDEGEEDEVIFLQQSNLQLLRLMIARFSKFCPSAGAITPECSHQIQQIQSIMEKKMLSDQSNPFYVDILGEMEGLIQKYNRYLNIDSLLHKLGVVGESIANHQMKGTDNIVAVIKVIQSVVKKISTCCLISSSPWASAITSALFFAGGESSKELCELAIQVLDNYITTISGDPIEVTRLLAGDFVEFVKKSLLLLTNQTPDPRSVAKLLFAILQIMAKRTTYGLMNVSQSDLFSIISDVVGKLNVVKRTTDVHKYVIELFVYATKGSFADFYGSYQLMVADPYRLTSHLTENKPAASASGKVSPARAQILTISSEEDEEYKSPAKKMTPKRGKGKTPERQTSVMDMFAEPGPSSRRTPLRKQHVPIVQSEEEEKEKKAKHCNPSGKKSLFRLPPTVVDSEEEESEDEDDEAASAKSRRRSRSLTRAPKKTGATTRAASASSSRYKLPHAAAPQGRARRAAPALNPQQPAGPAMTPRRRAIAALRNQPQHGMQEQTALGSPVINSDRRRLVLIANNCSIHNIHINALQ